MGALLPINTVIRKNIATKDPPLGQTELRIGWEGKKFSVLVVLVMSHKSSGAREAEDTIMVAGPVHAEVFCWDGKMEYF